MKKYIILSIMLLIVSFDGFAQKYGRAAGLRIGNRATVGLTIQQRVLPQTTIEGLLTLGVRDREVAATALVEYHKPFFGKKAKSFNGYIGAGGHVGAVPGDGAFSGLDAIMGVEYKLPLLPLLISADIKPRVNIGHAKTFQFQTGLSARYVFVTERALKRKRGKNKGKGNNKGFSPIKKKKGTVKQRRPTASTNSKGSSSSSKTTTTSTKKKGTVKVRRNTPSNQSSTKTKTTTTTKKRPAAKTRRTPVPKDTNKDGNNNKGKGESWD